MQRDSELLDRLNALPDAGPSRTSIWAERARQAHYSHQHTNPHDIDHTRVSPGRHIQPSRHFARYPSAPRDSPPARHSVRYPGDGMDFRRPMPTLPSQASIVDLTEDADVEILEDFLSDRRRISPPSRPASSLPASRTSRLPARPPSRLPRYPNPIFDEVIDLEALPDQDVIPPSNNTMNGQPPDDPTSPEVTFIRSVPRPLPPQPPGVRLMDLTRQFYQEHGAPGRLPPPPSLWAQHAGINMGLAGFLPNGEYMGDPLVVIDEASGYPVPQRPIQGPPRVRPRPGRRKYITLLLVTPKTNREVAVTTALGFPADRMRQAMALGHMQQGFHYQPFVPATPPEPPGPAYEPLPPSKPGFTRSPGEDDELICPRCEDELCKGGSETKQQAWVIKACGHVSCHSCLFLDYPNNLCRSTVETVREKLSSLEGQSQAGGRRRQVVSIRSRSAR